MSGFLYRFFPPPKYLDFPVVGLDVSDRSIKYVELKETRDGLRLKRYGEKNLPAGTIVAGEIKKPDTLSANLAALLKPLGLHHLAAALPEERNYISVMPLPEAEKEQIREAVELGLPEKIPLPAGEAIFDFELLRPTAEIVMEAKISEAKPKHQDAIVYAFPRAAVQSYLGVYLNAGLAPVSFALETAALSRALISDFQKHLPMILVDFGRTRTTFVIVAGGLVRFSSTVNVAGESLDQALAKALQSSLVEAEKIKKENGLLHSPDNRRVYEALMPVVSAVADEIERHILFWNTHAEHVHGQPPQIDQVILSGGDSSLIGFREYLELKLGLKVELGNPWINIAPFEKYIPELTFNESIAFSVAIGLSLMALKED